MRKNFIEKIGKCSLVTFNLKNQFQVFLLFNPFLKHFNINFIIICTHPRLNIFLEQKTSFHTFQCPFRKRGRLALYLSWPLLIYINTHLRMMTKKSCRCQGVIAQEMTKKRIEQYCH